MDAPESVRSLLVQIVAVRQKRYDHITDLNSSGAVSEGLEDQAELDLLAAKLELARYDEEHGGTKG